MSELRRYLIGVSVGVSVGLGVYGAAFAAGCAINAAIGPVACDDHGDDDEPDGFGVNDWFDDPI